ncbi:MAG TPA: hypothetical protein PL048_22740 [Leptospiraceae bacterium]|nr:hypothetical protein [Leptospiraceae bacterium]HMZ61608.1 hypothetical protein [Leptospiraceae bacterium]HNF25450.1 hypothetical protein [Leptospiraceae bacterium]HNI96403.1 hypothetical protein [Leptospiraceae bacterium]HNO26619.1 hypothetical protein [Leptospiraceae bacterium]
MKFLKWLFWFLLVFIGVPVSSFVFINLIYLVFYAEADSSRIIQSAVYNAAAFFLVILPLSWKFRQMKREAAGAVKKYTEIRLENKSEEMS